MMRLMATIIAAPALVSAGLALWIQQAQASQGPGVIPGTAGATTQLVMTIIVYGGSALVIAAGLVGAARQRRRRS